MLVRFFINLKCALIQENKMAYTFLNKKINISMLRKLYSCVYHILKLLVLDSHIVV